SDEQNGYCIQQNPGFHKSLHLISLCHKTLLIGLRYYPPWKITGLHAGKRKKFHSAFPGLTEGILRMENCHLTPLCIPLIKIANFTQ
ncbi:MAG: hypothetical protein P8184_12580, partial [Calditrichia bacterium]